MTHRKTVTIGRNAGTGRFTSVRYAQAHKATAIVQRLPVGRTAKRKSK